jgi:hypothetical protein
MIAAMLLPPPRMQNEYRYHFHKTQTNQIVAKFVFNNQMAEIVNRLQLILASGKQRNWLHTLTFRQFKPGKMLLTCIYAVHRRRRQAAEKPVYAIAHF